MIDSAEKLQRNWKRLSEHWDETCKNWKDEQQNVFEKKYWRSLTGETQDIIRASSRLIEMIESARRHVK